MDRPRPCGARSATWRAAASRARTCRRRRALPAGARRGVLAILRRRPSTCLERALVLQRWEAAHGAASDVVIGVPGPGDDFVAHAWLESMPDGQAAGYHEIHRIPAPAD